VLARAFLLARFSFHETEHNGTLRFLNDDEIMIADCITAGSRKVLCGDDPDRRIGRNGKTLETTKSTGRLSEQMR
jgi:hypothetical protein